MQFVARQVFRGPDGELIEVLDQLSPTRVRVIDHGYSQHEATVLPVRFLRFDCRREEPQAQPEGGTAHFGRPEAG